MTRAALAAATLSWCFAAPAIARAESVESLPADLQPSPPPDIRAPSADDRPDGLKGKPYTGSVSSIEVSGTVGPSVVFGDAANPEYSPSLRRVGVFGELSVAYRSSYFVDPFLAVGYAPLADGEAHLPSGPWGAGGMLDQRLDIWTIAPGITADIWRFRLRAALGLAVVVTRYRFPGEDHSSTQVPLAHQLGLGFNVLDVRRFRLDLEARYVGAPGADVTFLTFAAVMRGDVIEFGRR
jgi:hypothetical protein